MTGSYPINRLPIQTLVLVTNTRDNIYKFIAIITGQMKYLLWLQWEMDHHILLWATFSLVERKPVPVLLLGLVISKFS
jgi:hypothetical protein